MEVLFLRYTNRQTDRQTDRLTYLQHPSSGNLRQRRKYPQSRVYHHQLCTTCLHIAK